METRQLLRESVSIRTPTICTDMHAIDPGTLGLAIDDDSDYDLRSAVAFGTQDGHLGFAWAQSHGRTPAGMSFRTLWTMRFENEGRITSVRASPIAVEPPFVSCTTWGGDGAPGALKIVGIDSRLCKKHILRRGSAWCHEWQPHHPTHVSIGTEQCALWLNIDSHQCTRIPTGKSDVFFQQFDRSGQTLLNGSRDGRVRTFDLRQSPNMISKSFSHAPVMSHVQSISCMHLLRDETKLLVASVDGVIQLWDRRVSKILKKWVFSNKHSLFRFSVDPAEKYLSLVGGDGVLSVWDMSYHSATDENPAEIQWQVPCGAGWRSAACCAQEWFTVEGERFFCPKVVLFDGNSLASVPIMPKLNG